jgi:alkaline phosphatase D
MSRDDLLDPKDRLRKPSRRRALFAAGDLLLATAAAPALAQPAAVPPIRVVHGFADHQGISLWLQSARAETLRVEIRAEGAPARAMQSHEVQLSARGDFTHTLEISGLDPGVRHEYIVRAGSTARARGAFRTQALWQWRTEPPTVRIAAGSCAYMNDFRFDRPGKPYGGGEEIFDSIAAQSPDLMLWLGDNIYLREAEYTSRGGIDRRYRFYRNHPALAKLWTAAPHAAIWDDHDFGPDNADFSYSGRGWTHEMFLRYWPMPFSPPADGLYGKVLQGDVDIFMLDGRTQRYPERWPEGPDKALYGAKQMLWLKAALAASRAPFKLVVGGSQFFNRVSRAESWVKHPAEQEDFLRFLEVTKVPGVFFMSGDRHFASMLRWQRAGGLYPLTEITTSPLTSGRSSSLNDAERNNPDLVPGTILDERNFALVTVTGPRNERALQVEIRDTRGEKRWEWKTTAAELAQGTRNS